MFISPDSPSLRDSWLASLQNSGYRLTSPRRVIVELLSNSSRALSPLELFDLGRQTYPQLGLVTVYRTVERLVELGLVQRVHQTSGCHRLLRAAQGHEHQLICTSCGRVEYFAGDDLSALIQATARRSGFVIQDHWLQLLGLCADCQ